MYALRNVLVTLSLLVLLAGTVQGHEIKYPLNGDNTSVKLVGPMPEEKQDANFKKLIGELIVDHDKVNLSIEIDTTSIWSASEKVTSLLKSPDFLDVQKNPKAKFVSTKVEKKDAVHTITGDLTLNGRTKSINFPATLKSDNATATLTSTFSINKADFGMNAEKSTTNGTVSVSLSISAKKK